MVLLVWCDSRGGRGERVCQERIQVEFVKFEWNASLQDSNDVP